jgi:hypothetical protein
MQAGFSQIRIAKDAHSGTEGVWTAGAAYRRAEGGAKFGGDGIMQAEARSGRMDAVAAHPLAELLDCPSATGSLLTEAARCIQYQSGEVVFSQSGECLGLYVVVSGTFLRRAERMEKRVALGPARAGDLVELAAALGGGRHTYTLSAQVPASALLLPIDALNRAFQSYPPLRMQLLEELAREVSRAYIACWSNRTGKTRRGGSAASLA